MVSPTHDVDDDQTVILDTDQTTLTFHDKAVYPSAPLEAEDIIETTAADARDEYDAVACSLCFADDDIEAPVYDFPYKDDDGGVGA